jgi:cytochrome c oxidase subunit II
MNTIVRVLDENEYVSWLDSLPVTGNIPDPEGLTLMKNTGCIACHSLDGARLVGPTFKGLYGKKHTVITDGTENEIEVTDAYLIDAIIDPNKDIVKGFNKGLMQSYRSQLTDAQITLILDYLKTLTED